MATVVPVRVRPHPGFWWSVLWSLAFLIIPQGALVVTLGATLAVQQLTRAVRQGPGREGAASRAAKEAGGAERPAAKGETAGPGGGKSVRQPPGQKLDLSIEPAALQPAFLVSDLVALGLALLVIRLVVGRDWKRRLALRRPSAAHALLALLAFPCLVILPSVVYEWAHSLLPTMDYQKELEELFGQWAWWFGILAVGLGPGVSEELWCRGFLGRGLVGRYGPVTGILLTSLFFGALHLDPPHVLATAVLGIGLHFLYLTTRSLWVPMLLHFLNNSAAILAATVLRPGGPQSPASPTLGAVLNPVLDLIPETQALVRAAAVVLLVAVGWALYRTRVRIVPAGGGLPWQPDFPGVEYPPPGRGAAVVRPRPGWAVLTPVFLAALALAGLLYLPYLGAYSLAQ